MPNQLEEARRNGRFFVGLRDPRGFRYHTLLDSYKRRKTKIDNFFSEKERERISRRWRDWINDQERGRRKKAKRGSRNEKKLSEELIKRKRQRLEKKEQEEKREEE